MARWYYRSIFDELEDLRLYLELMKRQIARSNTGRLLPEPHHTKQILLPTHFPTFQVDVEEREVEIVVIASMPHWCTKEEISLTLIDPYVLEIICVRETGRRDEREGHTVQEWSSETITKTVSLPNPIMEEGSSARFTNGLLEIHLKKSRQKVKGKIIIH